MDSNLGAREVAAFFIRLVAVTTAGVFIARKLFDYLDPTYIQKKKSKRIAEEILKRIGVENVSELTEYEMIIATHLICDDTGVSWYEVGGYSEEIAELQDKSLLPLKVSCSSKLFSPPKGVLLYGPPGCGKTLIAKALAKAAGARFINLQVSTLTDKWYGESNKLAAAVFSLAKKLQPSIIFIDEIGKALAFSVSSASVEESNSDLSSVIVYLCFRLMIESRHAYVRAYFQANDDHEATAMMKALFMSLWDGFSTEHQSKIILLGATNRSEDVDPAILRRMPSRFYIGLPDDLQRQLILQVILKYENVDDSINFEKLALITKGFSGSDLKEVGRLASIYRVKESLSENGRQNSQECRPLTQDDLEKAVLKCKQSKDLSGLQSFAQALD